MNPSNIRPPFTLDKFTVEEGSWEKHKKIYTDRVSEHIQSLNIVAGHIRQFVAKKTNDKTQVHTPKLITFVPKTKKKKKKSKKKKKRKKSKHKTLQ
ncbi:MAG: hypothetical protein ACTSUE_23725 [Promethearchaeota archaeon]